MSGSSAANVARLLQLWSFYDVSPSKQIYCNTPSRQDHYMVRWYEMVTKLKTFFVPSEDKTHNSGCTMNDIFLLNKLWDPQLPSQAVDWRHNTQIIIETVLIIKL